MQSTLSKTSLNISITSLIRRFRWRIVLTTLLVLTEAFLDLLFPLVIGFAINDLLQQNTTGLLYLGGLGVLVLFIGSSRRFYDTHAYAGIYATIATEMVGHEQQKDKPLSTIVARTNLLREFVEFLENSMPMIVTSVIGVVGILLIILSLNISVFFACFALLILMIVVYMFSSNLNFRFNKNYNDELEKQVDILSTKATPQIHTHFKTIMKWNIRLSDLETANFAIIWLGIIVVLLYSPVVVIDSGVINFGLIFSILTYVFQYVDNLVTLPFFIQQIIRLQEISSRLRQ